jgi:rubrerythrin
MMADIHVFVSSTSVKDLVDGIKDGADALKLAIEFEKDSVLFFLSIREAASGKNDRELINSLVKEEQEHLRRLTLELRKLSDR